MSLVAIDCRFAHLPAGIGRFTREVASCLLKRSDPWMYGVIVSPQAEAWALSLPPHIPRIIISSKHYSLSEHWTVPRALRSLKADLLFAPQFNVPFFCRVPFIVTVHDVILHRFPNQASFFKRAVYRILFSRAVRKAKAVLTISKATEYGLVDLFGPALRKKLSMIPLGVSTEFTPRTQEEQAIIRTKYELHDSFFLYIGGAKEHKNVQTLIDAFSDLQHPTHALVLVISGREADQLRLAPRVTLLRDVPDADIPTLLSAAFAYVTATLDEGFGLPLLEAMACMCPVIATDIPVFRELFQDHALLVPPDREHLHAALEGAMRYPASDQHRTDARSFAQTFTWEKTAQVIAEKIAQNIKRSV